MKNFWQQVREIWRAEFFSPKDFIRRAVLIAVVFAMVHFLGWREFTSVLNGTSGSAEMSWELSAALGVTYVLLYLAAILLVPILVLAAGLSLVWQRIRPEKESA